jgi:hypothetical protein
MRALASSLTRIWAAKNRVPHLTGWGRSGSKETGTNETLGCWVRERFHEILGLARRTAPTIVLLAFNIFR